MNYNCNNNSSVIGCGEEKRQLAATAGSRADWKIEASYTALNTFNPIRRIVDGMRLTPHPEKELIRLTIGKVAIPVYSQW